MSVSPSPARVSCPVPRVSCPARGGVPVPCARASRHPFGPRLPRLVASQASPPSSSSSTSMPYPRPPIAPSHPPSPGSSPAGRRCRPRRRPCPCVSPGRGDAGRLAPEGREGRPRRRPRHRPLPGTQKATGVPRRPSPLVLSGPHVPGVPRTRAQYAPPVPAPSTPTPATCFNPVSTLSAPSGTLYAMWLLLPIRVSLHGILPLPPPLSPSPSLCYRPPSSSAQACRSARSAASSSPGGTSPAATAASRFPRWGDRRIRSRACPPGGGAAHPGAGSSPGGSARRVSASQERSRPITSSVTTRFLVVRMGTGATWSPCRWASRRTAGSSL